ncbi:MAG TPA: hypothetical protein VGK67_12520 [Myxococcales bacterium]
MRQLGWILGPLVFAAAVPFAGCTKAGETCVTDIDCGENAVCVEIETTTKKEKVKRCLLTCSNDRDCTLSGRFGKSCRPIFDTASGPAAVEPRVRYGRPNTDTTTRGAIRVCRDEKDGVR